MSSIILGILFLSDIFPSFADPDQIQIVGNTTSGGSPPAAGGTPQTRHLLQQGNSQEAANLQIQIRPTPDQASPAPSRIPRSLLAIADESCDMSVHMSPAQMPSMYVEVRFHESN